MGGGRGGEGQGDRRISSAPYKITVPAAETSSFTVCGIFLFLLLKVIPFDQKQLSRDHKGFFSSRSIFFPLRAGTV